MYDLVGILCVVVAVIIVGSVFISQIMDWMNKL